MCNRIFFSCDARPIMNIITSPFISPSPPSDLLAACWRSSYILWNPHLVDTITMYRWVDLSDDCKMFVGNLQRSCREQDVELWLTRCRWKSMIPLQMVIRGRSGILRGLDALTRGGGPAPIKVASLTGGLVPHMAFKTGGELRSLQPRRGKPPSSSR